VGRAARKKWEARMEALSGALTASMPKVSTRKPIDLWLGVVSIVVGIVFGLTEKTPMSIVFWLVLIFIILVHPIWNFWWLEKTKIRRISALALLAVALVIFGYKLWPRPVIISDTQLCLDTKSLAQRMRDFDHERNLQRSQMEKEFRGRYELAKTADEMEKIGKDTVEFTKRWLDDYDYDYTNRLRPEALSYKQQLSDRLPISKDSVDTKFFDDATFYNIGAVGILGAADRIEVLARQLCPQMFDKSKEKE
jgi:hypothetical protein